MNTRKVPGWDNAPVPICKGGDERALTFCCKPGYPLSFASICKRDETLKKIGITQEEFIKIKDNFSKENNWDSKITCFGSLSYCCMRKDGCPNRDAALSEIYKNLSYEKRLEIYFKKKKELADRILKFAYEKNKNKNR
ncbi:MAG: methanogenesis marker 9 domain-containing protein [Candidatus Aenigmarchaeota archaeon ex4484_56]|nr:MAG: methanogenesis marker 9 domain-containing protein [Candidatus Aenigmarchaeota archaeon ex4484_56]